jgi:site-specific recombinase XerD
MSLEWILDESKFLTKEEIAKLRKETQKTYRKALETGAKTPVRNWLVVDLLMSTGLRVQEAADLRCGDVYIEGDRSSLVVEKGKGEKRRVVRFSDEFKQHILKYLEWKKDIGEPTDLNSPLIYSTNTKDHISKRGIQEIFKRCAERANVKNHSSHHLRHTYATHLYQSSGYNLRLVQKQLGHARITTTTVYADVFNLDLDKALRKLYK